MSDPSLPPCRHRGQRSEDALRACHSSKLVVPSGLVAEATCRACPFPDHPPAFRAVGGGTGRETRRAWAVGLTTAPRSAPMLERTLNGLARTGWPAPRLFIDGPEEVPPGYEETRRLPAIGAWPNWHLGLAELIARQPHADAYLMLQDDVLFALHLRSYLDRLDWPEDAAALSLFCPGCYDGPPGFNRIDEGYGFAGAQALAFPRERAYQLIGNAWVANHRRNAPAGPNFRGDGLSHIDGAVGHWARLIGMGVYCHWPSLARHIGVESALYPRFRGKADRRFDTSFVGEALDLRLVSRFERVNHD